MYISIYLLLLSNQKRKVVEHCVSSSKVVGSIPREQTYCKCKSFNTQQAALDKNVNLDTTLKMFSANVTQQKM